MVAHLSTAFGQGGYSKEILKHSSNKVIAIDRDKDVVSMAVKLIIMEDYPFIIKNFLSKQFENKIEDLKAIIFDLGYSTNQIFDEKKAYLFKVKAN